MTAETLRCFGEGALMKPLRGRLCVDSLTINVDVRKNPKGILICGLPDSNRPGACDDLRVILDSFVERGRKDWGLQITLPLVRCSDAKQRVSWLRAAYLAAFAALGYRYIFRSVLDSVRRQIENPDEQVISFYHFFRKEPSKRDRFLMLVCSPSWAKGLLIQMGNHYVMLPFLDGDYDYYLRLEHEAKISPGNRLTGKFIPWPNKPEYLLD
jgi:hypothetical protein